MEKRLHVKLTLKERSELERFCESDKSDVRLVRRAMLILALDSAEGRKPDRNAVIAKRVGVSRQTLNTARHDFIMAGDVSSFLQSKRRGSTASVPKIDGETEARIIELARSDPPEGQARWTLRSLAAKCIELRLCESMSHMTISRILKKQKPGNA